MAIQALLFDFDGTLVDTEVCELETWREVFEEHGHELSLEEWVVCVGTVGGFDPIARLQELLGRPLDDPDAIVERRRARHLERVAQQALRPGVPSYLDRAAELGLRVAVVSSGRDEWITSNLARVGRPDGWSHVHCANGDVDRAKPLPCLYEEALASLGVDASEAIAFEDSPNGVRAAKAAGIFCVVVPNPVTKGLDLSEGDLVIDSFEDLSLDEVLSVAQRG